MKKTTYETPQAELIVIRIEESFLNSVTTKSIKTLEYDDDALDF